MGQVQKKEEAACLKTPSTADTQYQKAMSLIRPDARRM